MKHQRKTKPQQEVITAKIVVASFIKQRIITVLLDCPKGVEIFLVTRPPNCWKFDSCFWFLRKEKKGIKSKLVTKFIGIIITIIFI